MKFILRGIDNLIPATIETYSSLVIMFFVLQLELPPYWSK